MSKKNLFVVNIDIKRLYDHIRKAKVGDIFTYAELSELVRFDVQKDAGRQKLAAARKRALREDKLLFSAIPGQGIQRCTDEEVVSALEKAPSFVGRIARTQSKKAIAVGDYEALPNSAKVKFNTALAQLGFLASAASQKAKNSIEERVKVANAVISIGETLAALSNSK